MRRVIVPRLLALAFAPVVVSSLARADQPAPAPMILTPKPGPTPRINGPTIFGVRPGSPVLYTIPVTGTRPITYSAEGLPEGLKLDAKTGVITGTLTERKEHKVTLHASNSLGGAQKPLRIVVGDTIVLTPPMGWNSWNCWGASVSQEKVMSSARALVDKGLRDHGWSYINIDDGWQGKRGGEFTAIQPNAKFPDIKALADNLHQMGLKFGIYSTPWKVSYGGHAGSYADNADGTYEWIKSGRHDENFKIRRDGDNSGGPLAGPGSYSFVKNDVAQWVAWGVDYIKYDWSPIDLPRVKELHDALQGADRDIVYSLSNSTPYQFAEEISRDSNAWRTTGDIVDFWGSASAIGFNQDKWAAYTRPGHWSDPDMLVVGQVGWGSPHPSNLSPDEQYTHMSLWSLLAAPLLIGCDLAAMDDFTLSLLTNDEVIEVNQDALGKQGVCVTQRGDLRVYAKPLEDGSVAVGLFNLGQQTAEVTAEWGEVKLQGRQRVRNLWTQKDIGEFNDKFSASVPSHGVVFVRMFPVN